MKRDIDLIRLILQNVESKTDTYGEEIVIEGYDKKAIDYNAKLLVEAGYMDAEVLGYGTVLAKGLTYSGHDLYDSARDKSVWEKAKDKILKSGGSFTMEILKTLLTEYAKHKIGINN